MNRRTILTAGLAAGTALGLARLGTGSNAFAATSVTFEVTRTEAEWRAMLSDLEYAVMREEATERPFTSPLDKLYEPGLYHCKGCDLALYSSEHKYDSGTGWPSFWASLDGAIGTRDDRKLFMLRTECHCSRCGSHLGHIFDDGPQPTGKRHCLNGIALNFKPA